MTNTWKNFFIGKVAIKIDSSDYKKVSEKTWRIRKRKDTNKLSVITSVRTPEGTRNISLGQFLMKPKKGEFVYPRRYFEGLDYRKNNLIVCTMQERQRMLPKKRKDTTSNYRGVSYSKIKKLWRAGITLDGKSINLGDFKTETEAARAYNKASLKYFGKNGYQNDIDRSKSKRN